ncbi:MAG: DUF2189 domain-containing protein [Ignavibacteria bacterium]
MADLQHPAAAVAFPEIRGVDWQAPLRWLAAGWRDYRRAAAASSFYGICFAFAGWGLHEVFAHAYALFAGLVTGFLLVAPVLATGIYDLSRAIDAGRAPRLRPSLTAWRSNLSNIGLLAGVLAVVLLLWARASMVIFVLFFDTAGLPSFGDVVRAIVAFEQPAFAAVYLVVGGGFALFVFAISVVAVPLMLDRGTDAITAALASLAACARNPAALLIWAGCLAALAAVGFATWFVGLVPLVPLAGHATWHAYRELVGRA